MVAHSLEMSCDMLRTSRDADAYQLGHRLCTMTY